MEWATDKTKLPQIIGGEMKRFADSTEPTIVIPVIVKPIQIQIATIGVLIQNRHTSIVVQHTDRIV